MPSFSSATPNYKPGKDISFSWNSFRKGLNTLLSANEIDKEELSQADNLMLVGRGIPTKRWGSTLYHQAGNATGSVRGLKGFYKSNGTVDLVAITDDGFLTIKSGASYTRISGVSWPSGSSGTPVSMAQLQNSMYIVNGVREMVKYSNPTLVGFPTISVPSSLGASNISNASGTTTKSYRVSAISQVGETLTSGALELGNQPQTLGGTSGGRIRLTWGAVSTASGILQGYNIYGRDPAYERFLGSVNASSTVFFDDGSATPSEFSFPPTSDSTGGVNTKYIIRHQDRLVFGGIVGEPSKILISGHAPYHEKIDLSFGGNFLLIEPDAGDDITGLASFRDRIIVFKSHSIWQVTLSSEQIGNYFITTPNLQLITAARGAIAPFSIVPVENDILFLSREGVYSLGYESGFSFDVLRSKEISVKIRPYFDGLTSAQKAAAVGTYFDHKYLLAFPTKNEMMVLDTERGAWTGPWTIDSTIFEVFYDSNNNRHLLFSKEGTANVDEFSSGYIDDKGTAIQTILRTRTEDFGDWSLFKNIRNIFLEFQNVTGSISADVRLEQRSGAVSTAKSFSIAPVIGNSGWGADMWGSGLWGSTNGTVGGSDTVQTIRWRELNKPGRTLQVLVKTTAANANYQLLAIQGNGRPIGGGFRPSTWKGALIPFLPISFMQSMPPTMTGSAPSNEIFQTIIQGIQIQMMNGKFLVGATILALIFIAFKYFFMKKFAKSSFISYVFQRIAIFISWIQFAFSFFRQLFTGFFSLNKIFFNITHGKRITFFRTIFAPALFNSRWSSCHWFTTNITRFFKSLSVVLKRPTIQRSTLKRATFFIPFFIDNLKRLFTIQTKFINRWMS